MPAFTCVRQCSGGASCGAVCTRHSRACIAAALCGDVMVVCGANSSPSHSPCRWFPLYPTDTAGLATNPNLMSPRIQPPSPLSIQSPGQGGMGRARPPLQLEDPFARKFGGQLGMPPAGRGAPPKPPQLPVGKQLYTSPLVAALREKERQLQQQQQQQGAGSNGSAVDEGGEDAQSGTVRDRANAGRAAPLAIQIGRPKPAGAPRVENTSVMAQSPMRGSS